MSITREEQINTAKESFYKRILDEGAYYDPRDCFEEGAEWADEHPKHTWINVKDDLPCNHDKLIIDVESTIPVLVCSKGFGIYFDTMQRYGDQWRFTIRDWEYWMLIPKLEEN